MTAFNGDAIVEARRETRVLDSVGVLVVGGGVAGMAAAVAAARNGARTILAERDGCLGGTATMGLMAVLMGVDFDVNRGACHELVSRLAERDGALTGPNVAFDPETFKIVADEWLAANGVELLYHAWFAAPIVEGRTVRGAILEMKEGRRAVLAETTIDASGDGDVAAAAGAQFARDGESQPVTSIFRLDGVDIPPLIRYIEAHPTQFYSAPGQRVWLVDRDPPFFTVRGFFDLIRKAREGGELDLPHDSIALGPLPVPGQVFVNATRIGGVDGTKSRDLTRGEIEARRQAWSVARFLRRHVPGFGGARLIDVAARIGVRETRRIVGDYVLTREDLLAGRRFHDAVARNWFPMDVHGPAGNEEGHGWTVVPAPYEIPFRCLLPRGCEGLLAAGRCISTDHEAHGSIRSMPCCLATGQAAGTAAGLASRQGTPPRSLDYGILRTALMEQGVLLEG